MRESIVRAAELEHAAHNRIHKHKRFDENKLNKHFCCVLFVFWIKIKENEREALGESEKARGLDYVRCVYANVRRTCVLGRSYLAMMMNAASSGKVKLRARERAMHIPAQTYVVVTKQISVLICSVMHSKIYTQTELRKHIIKRPNKKCCVCSVCSVCVCVFGYGIECLEMGVDVESAFLNSIEEKCNMQCTTINAAKRVWMRENGNEKLTDYRYLDKIRKWINTNFGNW